MDQEPVIRFSELAQALTEGGFIEGDDFVVDVGQIQWQDYARITSKYSPERIKVGRDPYKACGIKLNPDYLDRVIRRFTNQYNTGGSEYISLMVNAHLFDLVTKLAFIKSARNGKVVTSKDLQVLFDAEGIRTIQ